MAEPEQNNDRRVIDIRVTGRVQGVGFRAFAVGVGRELGLDGYVENRPDGSVHARAAGPGDRLESFLEELRRGPVAARVEDVRSEPADSDVAIGTFTVRG